MLKAQPKRNTYKSYKKCNAAWIENIPSHWKAAPLKYSLKLISDKKPTLASSLSYLGMENVESHTGKLIQAGNEVEGIANRHIPGDILFGRLRPYLAKVALTDFEGLCSTEFLVYRPLSGDPRFLKYTLASKQFISLVNASTYGSKMPRASADFIGSQKILTPPLCEQLAISEFIETKTSQISKGISVKEQQISRLKERKHILIQNAVTRGLDLDVPMQDSGIEWIGETPKHWNIRRAKYLFQEIDERSASGQEELLSVSHTTGVTPRSEKNVSMFMAEDYAGAKTCQSGDLVFNIMWAWMGALGVADRPGIVSSSYGVFRQRATSNFNPKYLELLLKTTSYIEHYNRVSTGLHSSRLRLYPHMFLSMKIGFPNRKEQDQIIEHIDQESAKINRAIKLFQGQIERLKEYRATLIDSAVTGKIRVPGVEDPARQEAMA